MLFPCFLRRRRCVSGTRLGIRYSGGDEVLPWGDPREFYPLLPCEFSPSELVERWRERENMQAKE